MHSLIPEEAVGADVSCTLPIMNIRQGPNELDSSCSRARSSPVMLSAAKHLAADHDRPFAALRVTGCDSSHGQGVFFIIEPCLRARNLPGTIACPERDL